MTYAWRIDHPESAVFAVSWIIDAPWAHPVWNQYALCLYDLTTPLDRAGPVEFYLEGATHEFILVALDPKHHVPRDTTPGKPLRRLDPPNYGYQFIAESDAAAAARVQECVDGIAAGKLSPDTDFRSLWNKLWADAYPMVRGSLVGPRDASVH